MEPVGENLRVRQRKSQSRQVHEYQEFSPFAQVPEQQPNQRLADWIETAQDRTGEHPVFSTD